MFAFINLCKVSQQFWYPYTEFHVHLWYYHQHSKITTANLIMSGRWQYILEYLYVVLFVIFKPDYSSPSMRWNSFKNCLCDGMHYHTMAGRNSVIPTLLLPNSKLLDWSRVGWKLLKTFSIPSIYEYYLSQLFYHRR